MQPKTSLVVVQPTSLCNLNCAYCYVPNRRDTARMSDAILERTISTVLQSELVAEGVEFLWHAGEPLAARLAFYEKAVALIDQYNTRGIAVENSIQTNGTLIDARWCMFFQQHEFSVGLSVDGPAFLHDRQRISWSGRGTHREVMRGFALLRDHGVVPGAICVLTRASLAYPDEIFGFFLENGFRDVAFNVEEVENANVVSSFNSRNDSSEKGAIVEEYRRFVSRLYDLWRPHSDRMRIREFHDMFAVFSELLVDEHYHREALETVGLAIITVQKNGDITTFSPEFAGAWGTEFGNFVVGNIASGSLAGIRDNPLFLSIGNKVAEGVRLCRESCPYFAICGGSFTSNKYFENGSLATTQTTTCLLHRQVLGSVLLEKLTEETARKALVSHDVDARDSRHSPSPP